ncbi:GNAT family N-acetyltransferase [Rubellimicrobium aerolatum]|uniref:GNAT family N-acetyltransferase n=1 Tax=Rubellimicrobium aerolatum TaxID=490979 RepID=A0ABW0SFH7_9RHOB
MAVGRTEDLDACLALRRAVFIEEQAVPEALEIDGLDAEAVHLLATVDGRPVGTARLFAKGDTGKIGRVCVLREARGRGIGAALIRAAVEELRGMGLRRAKLGSQVHAIPFYEGLGFVAEGPVYDDAGIPHRDMARAL